MENGKEKYMKLHQLGMDFLFTAKAYGKIIIAEFFLPSFKKTIKPADNIGGVAGGKKYVVQGILFKFAHGKSSDDDEGYEG